MALPALKLPALDDRGPRRQRSASGYPRLGVTQTEPGLDNGALDATALSRVAAGDGEALRELYGRYGRMIHAIAYRVLRDGPAAEECVQDVFVELWRHAGRYDARRARVSTWLCTIARNRAIDAARARERRPIPTEEIEPAGQAEDAADLVAAADEAVRVADALAALPPLQLETVQLAYFDGLSYSEIAERLQIPLGTVKSRMRLALDRLRNVAEEFRNEELR